MTESSEAMSGLGTKSDSLQESSWSNTALMLGLCIPLTQWIFAVASPGFPPVVPWIVFSIVALLMLLYPLYTRRRAAGSRIQFPELKQVFHEAGVAIPVVIGCLLLNWMLIAAFSWLWPDATLAPQRYERLSRSPINAFVLCVAVYSVTYTPIAEEVFYRGFLINAFRAKMPVSMAIVLQAIIFGTAHGYGIGATVAVILLGVILGLVYHWRNTILTPIFVHAGFNAAGFATILASMIASGQTATLGVIPNPDAAQCEIASVVPDSPADISGLSTGDIILQINEKAIRDTQDLFEHVQQYQPEETVTVVFSRHGERLEARVTLQQRDQIRGVGQQK